MVTERFSVFLVQLDPATGAETAKTRPCMVVSPNELNRAVSTVIDEFAILARAMTADEVLNFYQQGQP